MKRARPMQAVRQGKKDNRHTRRWYKENFGVDPFKSGLPCVKVKNPYYNRADTMKLWKESTVLPLKDEQGIKKYARRKEAGQKAIKTRKKHLSEWLTAVTSNNSRAEAILKRLLEMGNKFAEIQISEQKRGMESCKLNWEYYWYSCGMNINECWPMTDEQQELIEKGEELFSELERVCNSDRRTILLAIKYLIKEKEC